MGLAVRTYKELKLIRTYLERKIFGVFFRDLHIIGEKLRLRGYRNDIQTLEPVGTARAGRFCIFIYYEPNGAVSESVRRVITALCRQDVQIVLACNHPLSEAQTKFFRAHCHTIILRGNQGFDIGAYKDVMLWLSQQPFEIERLALMNDSVFYASRGLDDFITALFGSQDVIAAFENWGEQYHLNSYALSVSAHVLRSEGFAGFWRDYVPVSNRIHAIEQGEKRMSDAALAAAGDSHVIFGAADLYHGMKNSPLDPGQEIIRLPNPWRDDLEKNGGMADFSSRTILDILTLTSLIHSGAYYFPKYLACPIFKKDIVYRKRFDFWEVESWIRDVLSPDEAEEYLTMLRVRGDADRLGYFDRMRFNLGVK